MKDTDITDNDFIDIILVLDNQSFMSGMLLAQHHLSTRSSLPA